MHLEQIVKTATIVLAVACHDATAPGEVTRPEPQPTVRHLLAGSYSIDSVQGARRDTLDFGVSGEWYDGWIVRTEPGSGCDAAYQPGDTMLYTVATRLDVRADSVITLTIRYAGASCWRDGRPIIGYTGRAEYTGFACRGCGIPPVPTSGDSMAISAVGSNQSLKGVLLPRGSTAFAVVLDKWRLWF